MKRITLGFLAVAATLLIVNSAIAQQGAIVINNVPNIVGLGVGVAPDYSGSSSYKMVAAPFAKFTFMGQRYVRLLAFELSANLLNHPWLRMGPVINYRFKRDDVNNAQVDRMEKIDGTAEAGGYVGVELINSKNPRRRFLASVQALGDIGDVYKGYYITLSARYWYPVSTLPLDVGIGTSATYADSNFMQTYYGVSTSDSARSGLPVYNASSGWRDWSVSPTVVVHLSRSWHVAAGVRYQVLLNSAANSPIVKDVGSTSQWLAGLGLAYSW